AVRRRGSGTLQRAGPADCPRPPRRDVSAPRARPPLAQPDRRSLRRQEPLDRGLRLPEAGAGDEAGPRARPGGPCSLRTAARVTGRLSPPVARLVVRQRLNPPRTGYPGVDAR